MRIILAGCAAIAVLAGCVSGGQGGAPFVATGATKKAASRGSWMAPGAGRGTLLYATGTFLCSENLPSTCVYSYPSGKLVGALDAGQEGLCSDRNGNVFFSDADTLTIQEYAHGGTSPIAVLEDPGYQPHGCSVDPRSGDLAVMNACSAAPKYHYCDGKGNIAIYRKATGTPVYFQDGAMYGYAYGSYDAKGNLFIGGSRPPPSFGFAFAELPRNGSSLTDILVDKKISYVEQVQWDGSAVTIEDNYPPALYRLRIAGTQATVVGTTHFRGKSMGIGTSWIHGGTIVVPYGAHEKYAKFIGFWPYPAGKKATTRIVNGFASKLRDVRAVTISVPR